MNFTPGDKLPASAVLRRYNIVSRTLYRWLADPKMNFPKPLVLNGRRYFDAAEIEEFERRSVSKLSEAA